MPGVIPLTPGAASPPELVVVRRLNPARGIMDFVSPAVHGMLYEQRSKMKSNINELVDIWKRLRAVEVKTAGECDDSHKKAP